MARRFLQAAYWEQLEKILRTHGCYITQNSRNVMEAILWKLRTGSPCGEIFQRNFVVGRQLMIDLTDGLKKVYGINFFYFTRRN
jgi:hypothetical protein